MAEKFTNYLFQETMSVNQTFTVIDQAGYNGRQTGSVCQIHSLYITQIHDGVPSNPEDLAATVSLMIESNTSKEYMIANNVLILPNSSFYIEKTITLKPTDRLKIKYTGLKTTSSKTISVVCSAVDLY